MQIAARTVIATAPAPSITLRMLDQLSDGRWLIDGAHPTILRALIPDRTLALLAYLRYLLRERVCFSLQRVGDYKFDEKRLHSVRRRAGLLRPASGCYVTTNTDEQCRRPFWGNLDESICKGSEV